MRYEIAPLFCRPWTLNGITPKLIDSHYENNYGALFARVNAISAELEGLDAKAIPPRIFHRLKQEQSEALNAALLRVGRGGGWVIEGKRRREGGGGGWWGASASAPSNETVRGARGRRIPISVQEMFCGPPRGVKGGAAGGPEEESGGSRRENCVAVLGGGGVRGGGGVWAAS